MLRLSVSARASVPAQNFQGRAPGTLISAVPCACTARAHPAVRSVIVRASRGQNPVVKVDFGDATGLELFFKKVSAAWSIFFPEKPKSLSPKDAVKNRLRMILVADRCGLSPGSMELMKESVLKALQDFVDIDSLDDVDINVSADPEIGTVYSVNIPVRRVKPGARKSIQEMENVEEVAEGIMFTWSDSDIDPDSKERVAARFPYGA